MSAFNQINKTLRRVHSEFAREFTVTQYSWDGTGGSNAYADGDWTEDTSTVQASIRRISSTEFQSQASGEESDNGSELWVNPTGVDVTESGEGDKTKATQFTDSATGKTYKAQSVTHEDSLLRVELSEVN